MNILAGGEYSVLAQCISIKVGNHKICLSLPLGIDSVCLPIPIKRPERHRRAGVPQHLHDLGLPDRRQGDDLRPRPHDRDQVGRQVLTAVA